LKQYGVDKLRHPSMRENGIRIGDGGWHFTYVGGHKQMSARERVLLKIECAAHQEFNNPFYKMNVSKNIKENKDVFFRDSTFKVVELDSTFPDYIVRNREKYTHLIKDIN